MDSNLNIALEKLFNERKDFIIIGLTGRTGSGCTTVAELLTKDFRDLDLPIPKVQEFHTNEERKYSVLHKYAERNWVKFTRIKMSDIITSFILEDNFQQFRSFVEEVFPKKDLAPLDFLRPNFDEMHKERLRFKQAVEENEENLKSPDIYGFYFIRIPSFTQKLKDKFDEINKEMYTKIYQRIASNIRCSGTALLNTFNGENIFKLAQRTNTLIKILRRKNKEDKGRVLVVIDTIRNPYEATFFKDRYSSFYLFSINTEEKERRDRLGTKGLIPKQIDEIDKIEYPGKLSDSARFWSQDIQSCIELSDVYLYNPHSLMIDLTEVKKGIVKYVTLIMHPGLISPTHVERSMQIAFNAKLNSGCISRQVGAVVTDDNYSIKSVGWNTVAECQIPCNLRSLNRLVRRHDKEAFSDYELKNETFTAKCIEKSNKAMEDNLNGRTYHYCFKDIYNDLSIPPKKNQVHTRSLHAEENAFLQISKYGGTGIMNGYLFSTASPCELCSKKAYQLGIKKIYYIDPYPGISAEHTLMNGSRDPEMILFQGAIGRGFTQLYTQILPLKDELEILLGD
ncbi:dCMP deaminase [Proteiniclasticum sp.]|uniref:dCMP deaminase n=1 Tax=Proteiniclasticum sp. TaxID=2053595 RepID=UPI002896D0CB|nr:dCMP deaminase [Proteiniclasticum sp.]